MLKIAVKTQYGVMRFDPKADVTTLELAEIMTLFFNVHGQKSWTQDKSSEYFDSLSDGAKRHFHVDGLPKE